MLVIGLLFLLVVVTDSYLFKSLSSKVARRSPPSSLSQSSSSSRSLSSIVASTNTLKMRLENNENSNIDSYIEATFSRSPQSSSPSSSSSSSSSPTSTSQSSPFLLVSTTVLSITLLMTTIFPSMTIAVDNVFDPSQFQPVCPSSDTFYQVLKYVANSLVGQENVVEYGPLIASVLLRIRLELCVLESFLYEAVIPFIQQKGISWVLPVHETVETFLAGTIFALASNFILLGSTKIISIVTIYLDVLTGFPSRLLGKGFKNINAKPIGYVFEAYGTVVGTLRNVLVKIDSFVGSYLVIATTSYIAFKFLHFKVFNGFPEIDLPDVSFPQIDFQNIKIPELTINSNPSDNNDYTIS